MSRPDPRPMPDSPAANALGCSCPAYKNGLNDKRGEGQAVDGVREFTVNPTCKLHANPQWWFSVRQKGI